jgi:mannitol-1-phosphate 5-dehydrogenase
VDHKGNAIIWGAGRIGRGALAEIFHLAGYHISFVVSRKNLSRLLKEREHYDIFNYGINSERYTVRIDDYDVIYIDDDSQLKKEIERADLIAVCVFPKAVASIAEKISELTLPGRIKPLNIFLCVNDINARNNFLASLPKKLPSNTGLIETVIMRTVIDPTAEMKEIDPLSLLSNGYNEILFDKDSFKGRLPNIQNLKAVSKIGGLVKRKIYTNNMLDTLLAYIGHDRGYVYIADTLEDPQINIIAKKSLDEIAEALCMEYGFSAIEMKEWNDTVLRYIAHPLVKDTCIRVGADPVRKLSRDERLTGAAILCMKHDIEPLNIVYGIAHGLLFDVPEDEGSHRIQKYISEFGITSAIVHFCDLEKNSRISVLISKYIDMIKIK